MSISDVYFILLVKLGQPSQEKLRLQGSMLYTSKVPIISLFLIYNIFIYFKNYTNLIMKKTQILSSDISHILYKTNTLKNFSHNHIIRERILTGTTESQSDTASLAKNRIYNIKMQNSIHFVGYLFGFYTTILTNQNLFFNQNFYEYENFTAY